MQAEDAPKVTRLLEACGLKLPEAEVRGLQRRLQEDVHLAWDESQNVVAGGFILMQPSGDAPQAVLRGYVHPEHLRQGIGAQLLSWQVQRAVDKARTLGGGELTLRIEANSECDGYQALFEAQGFQLWLTHCQMRFDLADPVIEQTMPSDIRLSSYSTEDSEAMRSVFNIAFSEHWIGELDSQAWRARFIDTEQFRPDLTQLARSGAKLVGFYLSEVFVDRPEQAWLEIIGVLPDQRGRGLGSALTAHAMLAHKAAGFESSWLSVDDENVAGAKRIYERLGYRQQRADRIFLRKVRL
jgi:mycothiol synthase